MSVYDELVSAIDGRRVISFAYAKDVVGAGRRIGYPHILYDSSRGNLCLDVYQIDGHSSQDNLPGWRPFYVAEINELAVLEDCFNGPSPDYNPTNLSRYPRIRHQF